MASVDEGLLRPFAFTVLVCGSCFLGCKIWQLIGTQTLRERTAQDIEARADGQMMVIAIISVNYLIFLLWQMPLFVEFLKRKLWEMPELRKFLFDMLKRPLVRKLLKEMLWNPKLQPFLERYFQSAQGNPPISMLLSSFSHRQHWHIASNMNALWSLSHASLSLLGKEQWLALYLSSATFSAFTSLANKVLRGGDTRPSLGASGAVMGVVGAVCWAKPDTNIPFVREVSAGTALKGLLVMDMAGLLLERSPIDHAGHLGGALFGILYVSFGKYINPYCTRPNEGTFV